jgi:hypothetical protein
MYPKDWIRDILHAVKKWQQRKASSAEINTNLKILKNKDLLVKFPVNEIHPAVSEYSFFKKSDKKWLDFYYSAFGKPDRNFIPVPVNYHIEDCLNDRMLTFALKEKNFYNNFMAEIKTPSTLLRRINGFFYDERFNKIDFNDEYINSWKDKYSDLFLKPSVLSGGGSSIMKFELKHDNYVSSNTILDTGFLLNYGFDFILQENITQHPFYRQFNPDSNNTLRFFIYRSVKTDKIQILHKILRIGARGSHVDHDHTGGVAVGIDDNNYLMENAFDINGMKCNSVNGILFKDLDQAPFVDEAANIARKIADRIYYGRVLALDFSIDEKGQPLFIELNCRRNGTNQYQMNNGGLFKEFTREVLDYCEDQRPKYIFEL